MNSHFLIGLIPNLWHVKLIGINYIMADEKKDFKEVKVKVAGGNKEFTDTISRSMLYSGVNIFGTLTKLYMSSKEEFTSVALN